MVPRILHRHPYEVQFWGYETGNVMAALAASGGIAAALSAMGPGWQGLGDAALRDLAIPVALAALIVMVGLGSRTLRALGLAGHVPALNWAASATGAALLFWGFVAGQNWLSTAAVAFLTGSALIRLTDIHPVLLKLGALFLALGGVSLGAFGVTACLETPAPVHGLTALTGFYVAGAGILTYVGGIFLSREAPETAPGRHPLSGLARALMPLDGPVLWLARRVVEPAIFWVPPEMKASRPFLTSMWARLPFRVATALAATLTFTPQGYIFALANILWAVGDVAIGALDREPDSSCGSCSGELEAGLIEDRSPT